jgi:hypothetical protein
MKPTLPSIALACCVATGALTANAQTPAQGAHSCRQLQDPAERLRCYDAQDAAASPAPATAPPVAVQPAAPSAPASAAAVAPPSAPPAAAVAAPPGAKFGEETLPNKLRPEPKKSDTVLVATISSVQEIRPKVFNIALANGQIWRQEGTTATVFFRAGADARIEKGLLGDYRMSTSTTGNGLWVRVTRIQ